MSQVQQVNASDLSINQLSELRRLLDEEIAHLTNSFAQLKQAQAKFKACIENAAEITPANKNKTILVPLTNSLYVPGKLADTENVIVDVGTGYFVKKNREQARKYYTAKVDYVQVNLETLQDTIAKKQEQLNFVLGVLQNKLQEAPSASTGS